MPDWNRLVHQHLKPLSLKPAAEAGLAEELTQHLEDQYRELCSGGASEEEACRQVASELDGMYPLEAGLQRSRRMPKHDLVPPGDIGRGSLAADLWRDLHYAIRTLGKSPGFVFVVVMTLALGIGANTTVFTLINTLVLSPLPVPDSSGLVALSSSALTGKARTGAPALLSYAGFKDYQARNSVFQSLAGYTTARLVTWQSGAASEQGFAELVTANYFPALGLKPARGRFFLPEEDSAPGAHPVAVLNYGTWQRRFGGVAGVIGKTLRLNNVGFTIIGVAPPSFIGVNAIFGPDLWIPAAMAEQLLPGEMRTALSDRGKTAFLGVGRLKPGITRSRAQADIQIIASGLAREYPATDEGHSAVLMPVRDVVFASASSAATPILFGSAVLLAVVAIVLLIACSNVANLLLARSAARRQEMAVRLAMGASRRRIVRQLLTESVLLGLLGGVLGMLVGYAGLRLLFGTLPGSANFIAPKLDALVFVFAFLVSLAAGFLFGTVPAFKASHASMAEALKEEARTMGRSRKRISLANALLVAQVAFSFLLLVTASLFLRSIGRAYSIDPGFQTAHLAIFMTNPGPAGYRQPQAKEFYRSVRERVEKMHGVESVSWSSNLPLWADAVTGLQVEGRQPRSSADRITAVVNIVDRNYFETAGVVIDRGRQFTGLDQESSTPVAIVNEKMAHDYWPGSEVLGKRIRLPSEKQMRQIVGIARNANYSNWGEQPQLCVYVPLEQNYSAAMVLFVRAAGDPARIMIPVESEIHAAGPEIMNSSRTGREIVDGGLFQARIGVVLLSVFGLLALGLASIGLYGIMAWSVNQRRREIGLRMALGAGRSSVLRLILKQGMSLVVTGALIGFAAALLVGRLLSRMLYGVSAADPLSVAGAALVLLAVALLACYLPARWASRVDPAIALREG